MSSFYDEITAETTDDELAEIEARVLGLLGEGFGAVVCDGLTESLAEERDSKRAGATV